MNNNKKIKRVLPLLLAVLLLISAGAYGTRAFFTDEEELKTSIKIETGTLDIVVDNESWIYAPLEDADTKDVAGDINDTFFVNDKLTYTNSIKTTTQTISAATGDNTPLGIENVVVSNARPGDAFTRKITIKNSGSLDVVIPNTFVSDMEKQLENAKSPNGKMVYIAKFESSDTRTGEIKLEKNDVVSYTMTIIVNPDANYAFGQSEDLNVLAKLALKNINITAKQSNDGTAYENTIQE